MSTNYLSDKSLNFWYDFLGLNYYMYLVKEKIQLALKFQYYCFSVFKTFRFKEIDQYCAFMLTKLTSRIFVALRRFLFTSICGIDIIFRHTVLKKKIAKLEYMPTCILEIREIRKIYGYMYIFNFDRIIRFKNYDF